MKFIIVFLVFIFSRVSLACSDIHSLYEGERRVQYDSNMCYAFSLSHALEVMTKKYVNPLDIAYRYKKLTGLGYRVNTIDFQRGASPRSYDAKFVQTLLAQGLCQEKVPSDIFQILQSKELKNKAAAKAKNPFHELSKMDQFRLIHGLYKDLIDQTSKTCREKKLYYPSGIRPVSMGFRKPSVVEVAPEDAVNAIDRLLQQGTPVVLNIKNTMLDERAKGYHSLTIIGRRKKAESGQCEYLLLDSSPPEVCKESTSAVSSKDCINGRLWVSRDRVKKHGISMIGFRVRKNK